jgi:ethanolamine-phosphate cytidylyltransferase
MLLACKYVDDVVVECPYIITKDLVNSLNIEKVINVTSKDDEPLPQFANVDQFEEVKTLGMYVEVEPPTNEITVKGIAQRVELNKAAMEIKFAKKSKSEAAYYKQKSQGGVTEI